MSPTAQKVALAAAMGWNIAKRDIDDPSWWFSPSAPSDYLNHRDAIMEVVRQRIEGNAEIEKAFLEHLYTILHRRAEDETRCICEMELALLTCSAAEYCEAALVALGKWVENE